MKKAFKRMVSDVLMIFLCILVVLGLLKLFTML